jgi:hypothetical protein
MWDLIYDLGSSGFSRLQVVHFPLMALIPATGGLVSAASSRVENCTALHCTALHCTLDEGWYNQTLQNVELGRQHLTRQSFAKPIFDQINYYIAAI